MKPLLIQQSIPFLSISRLERETVQCMSLLSSLAIATARAALVSEVMKTSQQVLHYNTGCDFVHWMIVIENYQLFCIHAHITVIEI
jgi:hypothetical protein